MNLIRSISIQIALRVSWRKHYTCHIRAFDRTMMTSFFLLDLCFLARSIIQQSKSITASPWNLKKENAWGKVRLTGRRKKPYKSSSMYAMSLINFPAGQVRAFISRILSSHRWETMCFIPLHCKSNLMLHALWKSSRKSEWMRWHGEMLTPIPTIPKATPVGH